MTADPVLSGAKVFSFGQQENSQTFSTNNLPRDHQRATLLGVTIQYLKTRRAGSEQPSFRNRAGGVGGDGEGTQ